MSKAAPDADACPVLHSSRCAREQNSSALGQNSAMTFAQDSSGSHPTAVLLSGWPSRMRTSIGRPQAPHCVLPTASAPTAAAIPTMSGAPRPQPDAVEDEAVTRPSRREPVDAHDGPVVHLGHPDGYDEVERLAGSFGRKASFVGDPIDERRSAR